MKNQTVQQSPAPADKVPQGAAPEVEQREAGCPIIGGVLYPPYMILWDMKREGREAVVERLRQFANREREEEKTA